MITLSKTDFHSKQSSYKKHTKKRQQTKGLKKRMEPPNYVQLRDKSVTAGFMYGSLKQLLHFHDDTKLVKHVYQSPPRQLPLLLVVPAEELRAQQHNISSVMESVICGRRGGTCAFLWKNKKNITVTQSQQQGTDIQASKNIPSYASSIRGGPIIVQLFPVIKIGDFFCQTAHKIQLITSENMQLWLWCNILSHNLTLTGIWLVTCHINQSENRE